MLVEAGSLQAAKVVRVFGVDLAAVMVELSVCQVPTPVRPLSEPCLFVHQPIST